MQILIEPQPEVVGSLEEEFHFRCSKVRQTFIDFIAFRESVKSTRLTINFLGKHCLPRIY